MLYLPNLQNKSKITMTKIIGFVEIDKFFNSTFFVLPYLKLQHIFGRV